MTEEKHLAATHTPLSNTDLAFERTALAYERTLMAWVRTAISLISFGFTIYKFFQELTTHTEKTGRLLSPRIVGMIMISFGLFSLVLAMIQHRRSLKKLKQDYQDVPQSLSSLLAIFIIFFALALFLGVLFRQ